MEIENSGMIVVKTTAKLTALLDRNQRDGKQVGFVPTMGYLHEGHLSLVNQARQENEIVVMSIFVNPAQFGPGEDLDAYPRDVDNDTKLAASVGVDILFIPSVEEMYPQRSETVIKPGPIANVLCGASRPGHFDGVLKVVLKLFNLVDPDHSYFGLKDAQQLAIIETFVREFNLRTTIVRVQTCRESDGLAKSSRNVNLTLIQREEAPVIYKALQLGLSAYKKKNSNSTIKKIVANYIESESSGVIDYVQLLSYPSLSTEMKTDEDVLLACAVKFGNVRLIDNIIM